MSREYEVNAPIFPRPFKVTEEDFEAAEGYLQFNPDEEERLKSSALGFALTRELEDMREYYKAAQTAQLGIYMNPSGNLPENTAAREALRTFAEYIRPFDFAKSEELLTIVRKELANATRGAFVREP